MPIVERTELFKRSIGEVTGRCDRGHDRRRWRGPRARALLRRAGRVGGALEGAGPDGRAREGDPATRRRTRGGRARRRRSGASTSATTRWRCDGDALVSIADRIRSSRPTSCSRTRTATRSTPTTRCVLRASSGPAHWLREQGSRARSRPCSRRSCSCSSRISRSSATSSDDLRRHHAGRRAEEAAMAEMKAQAYLVTYYTQRAEQRGNHARRSSGDSAIRYAEAFQRVTPQVVSASV